MTIKPLRPTVLGTSLLLATSFFLSACGDDYYYYRPDTLTLTGVPYPVTAGPNETPELEPQPTSPSVDSNTSDESTQSTETEEPQASEEASPAPTVPATTTPAAPPVTVAVPKDDVLLVECDDFDNWLKSQEWFNANAFTNVDRSQVDPDFNGVACDHPGSPHDSGVNAPAGQEETDSSSDSENWSNSEDWNSEDWSE